MAKCLDLDTIDKICPSLDSCSSLSICLAVKNGENIQRNALPQMAAAGIKWEEGGKSDKRNAKRRHALLYV